MTEQAHHFLAEIEPPQGLLPAILERIKRAARRRARVIFGATIAAALASGGALAAAVSYAGQELYTSGFYDYTSLLISDAAARARWQEVLASLVGALPPVAILAVLVALAALMWSLARLPRAAGAALRSA